MLSNKEKKLIPLHFFFSTLMLTSSLVFIDSLLLHVRMVFSLVALYCHLPSPTRFHFHYTYITRSSIPIRTQPYNYRIWNHEENNKSIPASQQLPHPNVNDKTCFDPNNISFVMSTNPTIIFCSVLLLRRECHGSLWVPKFVQPKITKNLLLKQLLKNQKGDKQNSIPLQDRSSFSPSHLLYPAVKRNDEHKGS